MSTNALATQKKVWWENLVRKQKSISDLLPRGVDPERFVKSAFFALTRSPRLFECEPTSVFTGILKAAEAGLDLSGTSGECYLIPFREGGGQPKAQFLIGYRGLLKLAHRSGKLLDVEARVVYEDDDFEIVFGLDRKLRHVPVEGEAEKAKPLGAYCIARFAGGGVTVEWMTRREIDKIRARSKARDNGPWVTDWAEMAKKTVARRASKYWPGLDEMQNALAAEEDDAAPGRGLALVTIPEEAVIVPEPELAAEDAAKKSIADENAEPPVDGPGLDLVPDGGEDLFGGPPDDGTPPPNARTQEVKARLKRGRS